MRSIHLFFSLLLTTSIVVQAQTSQVIPLPSKPDRYINDYAHVLSGSQVESLAGIAKGIEADSTHSQVVIVTMDSLPENTGLEEYSIKLATTWGVGHFKVDNGVLILVVMKTHQSRIEVGSGLESVLTDAFTKRLQVQHFNTNFRNKDFYQGFKEALLLIKKQISPEARALEQRRQEIEQAQEADAWEWSIQVTIGLVLFFAMIVFIVYSYQSKEDWRNARAELQNGFKKISDQLVGMGTFKNADRLLEKLTVVYNEEFNLIAKAKLNRRPGLAKKTLKHLATESKPTIELYNLRSNVIESMNLFLSKQEEIISAADVGKSIHQDLHSRYGDEIMSTLKGDDLTALQYFATVVAKGPDRVLGKIRDWHLQAAQLVEEEETISSAGPICSSANEASGRILKAHGILLKFKNDLPETIKKVAAYESLNILKKEFKETQNYLEAHNVKDKTEKKWKQFKKEYSDHKIDTTAWPIGELALILFILNEIKDFKKRMAKEDRESREEEDYYSTSSSRSSGSIISSFSIGGGGDGGSSSRSSNSTSFGGGGFGGGGSSNSW